MRRFVVALPLMVIALIASLLVESASSSAIPPAAQQSPEHVATLAATSTGQDFGYSVAVSGSTIVVGADSYNSFQGRVYVFTDNGDGTVTQQAILTASDAAASDLFGIAVAVDADTIVVGAVGKSTYRGAAYVFTKPGGGWSDATQTAKLTYASPADYDRFGYSVDVSGDTIVVGARDTDISASSSGSAQVFTKPGGG